MDGIPFLDLLLFCKFLPWSRDSLEYCILSGNDIGISKRLFQSSQRSGYAHISQKSDDGGRYHRETSPLVCRANQWIGFYMITASVVKELKIDGKVPEMADSLYASDR